MKKLFGNSLTVIGVAIGVVLLVIYPTMWLWNYVMPTVFGLPSITAWQSLALLILSQIFFKSNS